MNNIVFNAQLTSSVADGFRCNQPITNEGASYDKSSGVCICQFSGTSVFSWTQHHHTTSDLIVNDVSVESTATSPQGSKSHHLKAGLVVYDLQVGDNVILIMNKTAIAKFSTLSG